MLVALMALIDSCISDFMPADYPPVQRGHFFILGEVELSLPVNDRSL